MAALWAAVKLALDSALAYLVNENVRDPYMVRVQAPCRALQHSLQPRTPV